MAEYHFENGFSGPEAFSYLQEFIFQIGLAYVIWMIAFTLRPDLKYAASYAWPFFISFTLGYEVLAEFGFNANAPLSHHTSNIAGGALGTWVATQQNIQRPK